MLRFNHNGAISQLHAKLFYQFILRFYYLGRFQRRHFLDYSVLLLSKFLLKFFFEILKILRLISKLAFKLFNFCLFRLYQLGKLVICLISNRSKFLLRDLNFLILVLLLIKLFSLWYRLYVCNLVLNHVNLWTQNIWNFAKRYNFCLMRLQIFILRCYHGLMYWYD